MQARIYKGTGITRENIPDRAARVATWGAEISAPVLDIIQSRWVESISVKTTWAAIKDADYVKIDEWYYFVDSIRMTSADVALLVLSPDYLTSAGGAASLSYLGGITSRVHVPKAQDTFGKYLQPDPLTNPAEPLILETSDAALVPSAAQYQLVESSLDLYQMGLGDATAKTYTDATSGETVTVPAPIYTDRKTIFRMGPGAESAKTETLGTCVYDATSPVIQAGIQEARNLGVESGIIAAWQIPTSMVTVTWAYEDGKTLPYAASITDASQVAITPALTAYEYAPVYNRRALYGMSSRYGMLSASGNRVEYSPEDIYHAGDTVPRITQRADARYDGAPYYNYEYVHGQQTDTNAAFFRDACQAQTWRTLPIRYTTESGTAYASMSYDASRAVVEAGLEHFGERYTRQQNKTMLNTIAGVFKSAAGVAMGNTKKGLAGFEGLGSGYFGMMEQADLFTEARQEQGLQRYADVLARASTLAAITPEITFPYNNPAIRDYVGNGVIAYRYRLSNGDLARIDRLLTMYGYAVTKSLEGSDFSTRSNFNFVDAAGVQACANASGYLPAWWVAGINSQLSGGVRVWHVKPSPVYYDESTHPNN